MYTGISIPIDKLVVGHLSLLNLKVFLPNNVVTCES